VDRLSRFILPALILGLVGAALLMRYADPAGSIAGLRLHHHGPLRDCRAA
jgi:hypothetical protein